MTRLVFALFVCLASSLAYATSCENELEPSNCEMYAGKVDERSNKKVRQFEEDIKRGKLRERTNFALNAMVRFAVYKLKTKGQKQLADQMLNEWQSRFDGMILRVGRDLGDHEPLSQWLAEKYMILEFIFGSAFMEATRLSDIKTLNYALPVVFRCVDNVDEPEFGRHFIPFSGVVIYWGTFFACVGGTWGTGFLYCSPISWGCEYLTENFLAPRINPTIWRWSCQ